MNNIYLLGDKEYNDLLKNKSYSFKREILISNFNILISKVLNQLKLIIKPYKKDIVSIIDNIENKLKMIKIIDNNFLFNRLYGLILEYQNLFERDINKYLNKEEKLFNTVYNIFLGITNNKNLLEKIKRFIKENKERMDVEVYEFIIRFIKKDILERIILLVKFLKKKILAGKIEKFLNKMNLVVVFKINKLLIYVISKIADIEGYLIPEEDINNLSETDKLNIKVCLSFFKVIAEEVNNEILKYIKNNIKKKTSDSDSDNDKTEYLIDDLSEDFIYIIKNKKKEIKIKDESLKYVLNYKNILEIYNTINWKEDLHKILEIEKVVNILDIIKDCAKKEFNIENIVIDNYLHNLFITYLNKDNIYNVFNSNTDNFTELFNNIKYLFIITNRYFKLELER